MPKKLEYEDVKNTFVENGCKLISDSYINSKQKLSYIAKCGHTDEKLFDNFKRSLSKNCIKCIDHSKNFEKIHYKTFKKNKSLMETYYPRSLKYRDDYLPENYNKTIVCWDCKETKNRRLFPYRKQYADNKEKRCKSCSNKDGVYRKLNHTEEQVLNTLLNQAKTSSTKREKRKRICVFDITLEDVKNRVQLQNNKCIYTGREFVYAYNESDKPSIDRIDSNKGYTKDNIQMVTTRANAMKNDMTHEEFLKLIEDIYKNCK
jgi:hypothetical protein